MLEYLIDGGLMMIPLMLCSILAVAVIIDRVLAFRKADADTHSLRMAVSEALESGKLDAAIEACKKYRGPVAAVTLAGLDKLRRLLQRRRPLAEIELNVGKTMEDFAPHVLENLEKRLNILALIAAASPLLGMTGTVTGMIKSFDQIVQTGGGNIAEAAAGGISEALVTTAAGLLIALPALVAYNLLTKRIDRYTLEIEKSTTELIDFISLRHGKESSKSESRSA
ncbi:MAG: MotA/TolQ/ExbB proton channel family protein [Phycisphaeraceae bacterium]